MVKVAGTTASSGLSSKSSEIAEQEYKPHRPTAKRLLNQIGSRYALSNLVLALFAIPAYGTGLVFEYLRLETTFLERLLVATAGYLATIIALLIARKLLFAKDQSSKPVLVLGVFVLAGFARGGTLLIADVLTGQHQPGEEFFRLLGGPVFTFATLTVLAVLGSNYQRHRDALSALADERYRLQIRSAGIRAKVQIQREELLSKVRSLLDPAIAKIQSALSGSPSKSVIESLQATVEDVVRPLSAEVAEASDELEAESGKAVIKEKASLPKQISLGEFILPLWSALISAVSLVAVAFLIENPLNALLIVICVFLLVYSILGLIQLATFKLFVPPVLAAILVPASLMASLSPFYVLAPALGWNVRTEQVHALLLFGLIVGGTTFAAQFVQLQRKTTTEKLRAVNEQIEILNAALRQELWLNRRRTAAVLHGPVQAALYASAMKLSQSPEPTQALVQEVQRDIQDAISKLNNPSNLAGQEISDVLNQIVEVWSDTAQITIELSENLEREISKQPLASEALIEISREFITNAVKHGRAKSISLRVYAINRHLVAVEVYDDGVGIPPGAQPGFGSKLLTELSLVWRQTRKADKTFSYAEIVLGQEAS